ncbi:TPA: radical SAM protein [Pasteurella multocida]|nr:radical SAM protein [Pasteurella multocida]
MHWLNIANFIEATEVEGPGLRFVIWVQGCLKRCKGCCNADLLRIEPATLVTSGEVIQLLRQTAEKVRLEGVTFLGGEPMLQADGLADIAEAARDLGLSVMIFTGYNREEITESRFKGCNRLLNATDLLIDGEFEQDNIETKRNWVGSTNQRFHYLSDFYTSEIETRKLSVTNEWRISLQGDIVVNGLPFRIR